MFNKDTWQEIYYTLSKNKLRTFLTAFGVIWGIFMLIVMLGAGNGMLNGTSKAFGDFATNSVFIWPQTTTIPYKGFDRGRPYSFNDDDTKALIRNIKEIKTIAPRINTQYSGGNNLVIRQDKSGVYNIQGDYPEFNMINPANIVKGRFINQTDIKQKRKVAVIGKTIYEQLYNKGEEPIGSYLKINGIYMQVVGLVTSKQVGDRGNEQNQWVILPFTTMQTTYNLGNKVGYYAIAAHDDASAMDVEKKVRTILKRNHTIDPNDDLAIGSFNVEKMFNQMTGLLTGISTLIWIVGFMTLLAGVIGVSNIMLIIVKERTREIGIKRAIGASPYRIISQILYESTALTTFAGYIGLMLGIIILELLRFALSQAPEPNPMFLNPEVYLGTVLLSLFIIICFGLLAGLIPAMRAVSIKPVDAIKD